MNIDPNTYKPHHNLHHTKAHLKRQILQPNTPPVKITMHKLTQGHHPQNQGNDYQLQRRKTLKFIPFRDSSKNKVFATETKEIACRMQRGSQPANVRMSRQNNFINPQDSLNNSSRHKLKVLSNSKGSSYSRSENNSTRKLRGIQLTKSKGISGLYNDKDFQVRQSFTNLSQKQTEGVAMNGKVFDQYQINDYQTPIKMVVSTAHPHLSQSRTTNTLIAKNQHQKNGNKQTAEQIANHHNLYQPKTRIQPQRQLLKVKSYDVLPVKSQRTPIFTNKNPLALIKSQHKREPPNLYTPNDQQLFLSNSKRKTLDQLSLKQSLIIQFDPYRR